MSSKVKYVALCAILLASAISCSPKLYPAENTSDSRDTVYVNKVQIDSIYRRDSVFIREKNDTIYIYKEKIREHYTMLHDTTYISHRDTLHTETINEVPMKPTKWQSFEMICGDIAMIVIGIILLALITKFIIRRFVKL